MIFINLTPLIPLGKKVKLTILGHYTLEEDIKNFKSARDSSLLKY